MKIKSAWHALELTLEQWISRKPTDICHLCCYVVILGRDGFCTKFCPVGILHDGCFKVKPYVEYMRNPTIKNKELVISAIMGIMEIWNNRYVHTKWYEEV